MNATTRYVCPAAGWSCQICLRGYNGGTLQSAAAAEHLPSDRRDAGPLAVRNPVGQLGLPRTGPLDSLGLDAVADSVHEVQTDGTVETIKQGNGKAA